jgi:hypothetical protein
MWIVLKQPKNLPNTTWIGLEFGPNVPWVWILRMLGESAGFDGLCWVFAAELAPEFLHVTHP